MPNLNQHLDSELIKKFVFLLCVFWMGKPAVAADTLLCNPGYYISNGQCVQAPGSAVSPGGTSTKYDWCNWKYYINKDHSVCTPCPPEYPYSYWESIGIERCFRICAGGTYMASTLDTKCTVVGTDEWAPMHLYLYGHDYKTDGTLHKCSDNTRTLGMIGMGADDETDCAHILHVDAADMRLVKNKKTVPALAVLIDDALFWAQMSVIPYPMSQNTANTLRISHDDIMYYAHDNTVLSRAPYPWENLDYDWSQPCGYTFDNVTWRVTCNDNVISGSAKCESTTCYCKMDSPAVGDWTYKNVYSNCATQCANECGWGFAYGAHHKLNIITGVSE